MAYGNGGISDKGAKVAHAWANQTKTQMYEAGRETAYRIWFEGKTIYSYTRSFPIATIHTNEQGVESVLFTNNRNSKTTNKHIGAAWDACSQYTRILCDNPFEASQGIHRHNLNQWNQSAQRAVDELAKARNKESRYSTVMHCYNEAKTYADYFGIEISLADYPALFARPSKEFEAQIKAAQVAKEAQERKAKKQAIKKFKQRLKEWRDTEFLYRKNPEDSYAADYSHIGVCPMGFSYFRYCTLDNRIQTSQGVNIPILAAKRFLTIICPAITKGEIVTGARILDYTLLEANQDYIRVGCHKITVEEINRQAKELGWDVCKGDK
jgi:hypothetical protein